MEPSKVAEEREPSLGKFVSMSDLQRFECPGVLPMREFKEGAKCWEVTELDRRILGEALFQIAGERLRSGGIACDGQRESGGIRDVAPFGKLQRGVRAFSSLSRSSVDRVAHGCCGLISSRYFPLARS